MGWREGIRILRQDTYYRVFLVAVCVLHLPYALTWLPREELILFNRWVLNPLLLPLVMYGLLEGLKKLPLWEQPFWRYAALAFGFWWIDALAFIAIPGVETFELLTDCLFILFYMAFFLAQATRPHLAVRGSILRNLESVGALILLFSLLLYFVVLPMRLGGADGPGMWLPPVAFHWVLDLLLALRFGLFALQTSGRWRRLYAFLCVIFLQWNALASMQILIHDGSMPWVEVFTSAHWTDLLWSVPVVCLVTAARLRFPPADGVHDPSPEPSRDGMFASGSLVFFALSLPTVHLLVGHLEQPSPELVRAREWLVLLGLTVLGFLMFWERRTARRLGVQALAEGRRLARMRLERDLAERGNRAKGEFLANMSHEIRTPMHGILGMAEHLARGDLNEGQRHSVEVLTSSTRGLLRIIDDIMDFSKIEAGELSLEHVPFTPADVVEPVVDLERDTAEAKGLTLTHVLRGEAGVRLLGDPARLRQVVLNLVSNALKFTAEGSVMIEAFCAPLDDGRYRWTLEVRDTGIGIAEEAQAQLFEPFQQAETSTSRRFGGSGLGLAISHHIVRAMGGTLRCQSEVGEGATFTVSLVLEAAPSTPQRTDVANGPDVGTDRRGHFLVVEDNPVNRLVVIQQLCSLGHRVEAVDDGKKALESLERNAFDAILMDCHMPGLDGFTTTRRIRDSEPEGQRIPIIALTADAQAETRERCLASGMDEYLTKPYTFEALVETLERCGWTDRTDPDP